LVQREHVRSVHDLEPAARPLLADLLVLIFCNGIVPQLLWSKKIRVSPVPLFAVCMFVNVGMWLERFVIVITSLHRDYIPARGDVLPDAVGLDDVHRHDWLVPDLFYVFVRLLPMISIFEIRTLAPEADPHAHAKEEGAHV